MSCAKVLHHARCFCLLLSFASVVTLVALADFANGLYRYKSYTPVNEQIAGTIFGWYLPRKDGEVPAQGC